MNCTEARHLVHAYHDAELGLNQTLEIEQHLAACPGCSAAYDSLRTLQSALRDDALYFKAPTALQRRIRTALHKQDQAPAEWFVRTWWQIPASMALASVLTLTLTVLLVRAPEADLTDEVVASHVRSLQYDHLTDVPSSNLHQVKPWFNGKLDYSPPVQDFAEQGFTLQGGRLDYFAKRQVAALAYRHKEHPINVLLWPAEKAAQTHTERLTRDGYHVVHWVQQGMNYWVISELNTDDLQRFIALLQGAS